MKLSDKVIPLATVPNGNLFVLDGQWCLKIRNEPNSAVKAYSLTRSREVYFYPFEEVKFGKFDLPIPYDVV